jgi:hypothetical protein
MQRGLVERRAGDERLAILIRSESQAPKPVGPFHAQMTFQSHLVGYRLVVIRFWVGMI